MHLEIQGRGGLNSALMSTYRCSMIFNVHFHSLGQFDGRFPSAGRSLFAPQNSNRHFFRSPIRCHQRFLNHFQNQNSCSFLAVAREALFSSVHHRPSTNVPRLSSIMVLEKYVYVPIECHRSADQQSVRTLVPVVLKKEHKPMLVVQKRKIQKVVVELSNRICRSFYVAAP